MGLEFKKPEQVAPIFKIMLYGRPGTGKTVGSFTAPGPILYVNADRPHAAAAGRSIVGTEKIHEVAFEGAKTLDEVFRHVAAGCEEKTVVLDTVGGIYEALLTELAGAKANAIPSIDNYLEVQNRIMRFVLNLRDYPVNLVLICHEQIDDSEAEVVRRPMTGGQKLPERLMGEMDIVAYTAAVEQEEGGKPVYVGQTIEGSGRRAKPGPSGFGPVVELNLAEWIDITHAAVNGNTNTQAPKEKAAA